MNKYTVERIETEGVEATGFYGEHSGQREGWLLDDDFVDYSGYAQIVRPATEMFSYRVEKWSKDQ